MHKFLRAAGFGEYKTESAVYSLITDKIINRENLSDKLELDDMSVLVEYRLPVNEFVGIKAAVTLFKGTDVQINYYYPYYDTYELSTDDECEMDRHTLSDTYSGIIDSYNIGLSLIFFLSNPIEYRKLLKTVGKMPESFKGTNLSAFALSGKVLLPVIKNEESGDIDLSLKNEEGLIEAALNGDENAMKILTATDISRLSELSDRIDNEDLYSLVDQSFMPSGTECDQYSVIGEILSVRESVNQLTNEKLWLMKILSNEIHFGLCMRKDDLLGEPLKGRRIKAKIWMQGNVNIKG